MKPRNKRYVLFAILLISMAQMGMPSPATANLLPSPTRELREMAMKGFADGNRTEARQRLMKAAELAHSQRDPYVKSNELRYIADAWAKAGVAEQAASYFAEAMDVANKIPTWNHRLYATIGVVEMQSLTGNLVGVRENALKAVEAGLIENIAEANGEAAEMGRFFAALDGAITDKDRVSIRQRIEQTGNPAFKSKALYALENIAVRGDM